MKIRRYIAFYIIMGVTAMLIAARLINLQIANGEYYRKKSDSRTMRSIELSAQRGEILDRNGRPIVTSRTGYNVYIMSNRRRESYELNRLIANLYKVVDGAENEIEEAFPLEVFNGRYSFLKKDGVDVWKQENGFKKNDTAASVMSQLIKKYDIGKTYTKEEQAFIAGTRLNMTKRGFSASSPYLFMEDVPIDEISIIKEQSEAFSDVSVVTQPIRTYPYKSLGAHMLGRVGMISSDEYEENKENGYTINSYIGKSGIEKLLEEYLKGENGGGNAAWNSGGHSVGYNIDKEPVSGRNVMLTIDLDMQIACEKALEETIREISSSAVEASGGRDADAGSIVVIDVNSGDVLAMVSYPSYEIETFSENYNSLLANPSNPLFNRALSGTYSPASTFKLLVGAAALQEGVITPEDKILDTGKYTYFSDYQPGCWIYNQSGDSHGYLNVSEAVRDSCNIFFFDTGRRLGINKINEYAKKFGFGQKSGIELSGEEKTGVVASPANRKKMGEIWYPGDVCQTAIGQSDTLVTPIQLANYIAAIANGGTRYKPHLIKSIANADKTAGEQSKPKVLEKIDMDDSTRLAITEGMRMVVTEGTAFNAFLGCSVKVAAKTGSAQTAGSYTNGVCVAYAPYDKPQIAIACVIEKAGSGAKTANVIRKVVDAYFDNTQNNNMQTNVLTR